MMPPDVRIFVCLHPVDFRRSFDGLAQTTREILHKDPQSGALFVFVNKRKNRIKALWWDQTGYCLLYKRLHQAIVVLPEGEAGQPSVHIDGVALRDLIAGQPKHRSMHRKAA